MSGGGGRADRRVYVGCSYPLVRVFQERTRKGKHQALCSCGWEGPRRRKPWTAKEDIEQHIAKATPEMRPFAPQQGGEGS